VDSSIYPHILAEKTWTDDDNKLLLFVHTELIVMWLHGDVVYSHFSVESMISGYHEYKVCWNNPVFGEDLLILA